MLNATAQIPFEDMDCFMQSHKTMQVPFPYRRTLKSSIYKTCLLLILQRSLTSARATSPATTAA